MRKSGENPAHKSQGAVLYVLVLIATGALGLGPCTQAQFTNVERRKWFALISW